MENVTTSAESHNPTLGSSESSVGEDAKIGQTACNFVSLSETNGIQKLLTNPFCYRHDVVWTTLIIVVYIIIFLFGLVGNLIVIWVIRRPRMRTVTNTFILNLAVADLLVIAFCIPSTLLSNVFVPWVLGNFMCKTVAYVQGVSVFASVYSLVAVSVERSQAISRPLNGRQGLSKFSTGLSILIIWLTAGLITSPFWSIFEVVKYPPPYNLPFCVENWAKPKHGQLYFLIVHLIICYSAPLLVIIVFNALIWKSVAYRTSPENPASSTIISELHRKTKLRVLKMLASLTFTFFVCWLPLYVVMTVVKMFGFPQSSPAKTIFKVLIPFSQILGSCNSCLNPVLYAFLNRRFRETFKSLLSPRGTFRQSIMQRRRQPSWNIQAHNADATMPNSNLIVYSANCRQRQSTTGLNPPSSLRRETGVNSEMVS